MTIFLKFSSEAVAIEALAEFRGVDENGNPVWLTDSHTHNLYPQGTITKPTGHTIVVDGVEVPEYAPIAGWHCNFLGTVPEDALPYVLDPPPENPVAVFGQ